MATESLWAYPGDFIAPTRVIIARMRGDESIPTVECLHAGWHLLGYGLSHFDPHPGPKGDTADDADTLTDVELADKLECCLPKTGEQCEKSAAAFPWALVVPVVVEFIRRLLER